MFVLQIEHVAKNFESWKKAFDSDPANRKQSGVKAYRILRSAGDPNLVIIELEFNTRGEAELMHEKLGGIWKQLEGKVIEGVKARVCEVVETITL